MEVNKKSQTSENRIPGLNPFPGLRPFTPGESDLFFGREEESREVVEKLCRNRFVTVTGPSGTGKSSLISCGVIPAIRDFEKSGASFWRIIAFKPSNDPFNNLGNAIANHISEQGLEKSSIEKIQIEMHLDPDGITAVLKKHILKKGENILLVIDQFEELFRYSRIREEGDKGVRASEFIEKLVKSVTQREAGIYAIVSMRSDFIGECSHYPGLTQVINDSNFLVPHMGRENYRRAIEMPVKNAGASIDPKLVENILNDIGDRDDQLPVLQHALMRTWDHWRKLDDYSRPISITDYESVGTMSNAMSRHASEAYDELDQRGRETCERMFRLITEKGPDNKGMRRPSSIRTLKSIIQCSDEELSGVIEKFRSPGRSFIMPGHDIELTDDSVIDISHESLIRQWDRLREWVDAEAESVQVYQRLSEASAMYQNGRTGLLRPPDLQLAINWRDRQKPGLQWAQRYDPAFERTMVYLRTSEKEYLSEEDRKARIQSGKIKKSKATAVILGGAAILAFAFMIFAIIRKIAADEAAYLAKEKQREEELQRKTADSISKAAIYQKAIADSSALLAMQREKEAVAQKEIAVVSANLERLKVGRVEAIADSATRASIEAKQNEVLAIEGKNEALRLRMISIGRSMSVKSLQVKGEKDLQTLLAYQAYIFNKKNGGIENDADIYTGLYNVARQYGNVNCRTFRHDGIKSIAFVPGKNEFYTAGSDFQVRKWSLEGSRQTFQVIYTGTEIIEVLAVSPDASWLACGSEKNSIRMIPLRDNSLQYLLNGHTDKIKSLIFSFDGKYLYSASLDGKVLKWDIAARTSKDITSGSGKINTIDISSDGNYIAGLNPEGNVILWNPESVTDNFRLPTGLKDIRAIRFKPDENTLAIGDVNGNVELWDIYAKEKISEIKAHSAQVNAIEFNPILEQMATAGKDNTLRIYNNLSDLTEPPVTFADSGNFVIVVRFSPDGQLILSGAFEGEGNLVSRPSHADLLAQNLCSQVSRNFTQEEWNIYVGRDLPLEKTCEGKDYNIKVKVVK